MNASAKYRPEIDGLRALAVSAVILYHYDFGVLPAGFLGVDVFFVISGYLITSIIYREAENNKFSIAKFYVRRAKRILPAFFVMVFGVLFIACCFLDLGTIRELLKSSLFSSVFLSNIYFYFTDDYFGTPVEDSILLHTWSLAVEEQYYLIFPLLLIALLKLDKRIGFLSLAVLCLFSLLCAEYAADRPAAFYLLQYRAWELGVGALCAFVRVDDKFLFKNNTIGKFLPALGICIMIPSFALLSSEDRLPGFLSLCVVFSAALVILYGDQPGLVQRVLSSRIFVFVGLISYSAYLWHQPIHGYAERLFLEPLSLFEKVSLIGLVLAVSYASYRFVEIPFKKYEYRSPARALTVNGVVITVFCVGLVVFYKMSESNLFNSQENAVVYGGAGYPFSSTGDQYGSRDETVEFILYGDSHAHQYLRALDSWAKSQGVSFIAITQSACMSLPAYMNEYKNGRETCANLIDNLRLQMSKFENIPVLLAFRWGKKIAKREPYVPLGMTIENRDISIANHIGRRDFSAYAFNLILHDLVQFTKEWPKNRFLIIGNVPTSGLVLEGGLAKCQSYLDADCPIAFNKEDGEMVESIAIFEEVIEKLGNVEFADPYHGFCSLDNMCVTTDPTGLSYYSDHAHLSTHGANVIFEKVIHDKLMKLL